MNRTPSYEGWPIFEELPPERAGVYWIQAGAADGLHAWRCPDCRAERTFIFGGIFGVFARLSYRSHRKHCAARSTPTESPK